MSNIEVYFYGLICHIGPDDGFGMRNAALVTTDTHQPRVIISTSSGITECDLEKGDVLSLSVGKGDAVPNTSFTSYVPSLRDKTDKPGHQQALKNGVRTSSNFDTVTAYFLHAESSLAAAYLFPHKASYSMKFKATVEQCVAELTLAIVRTNADKVDLIRENGLTSGRDDSWEIADWVLITNRFHTFSGGHFHLDHFENHLRLTDASEIAVVGSIKNGCSAEQKAFLEPRAVHLPEVRKYIAAHSAPPLESSEPAAVKHAHPTFYDLGQVDCSDTRWP